MSNSSCRWGILGAATIARKNWKAIRNAENCTLVAVASRDIDRSRQFIAECQSHTPHAESVEALGSYDELLNRDDIDAVYIPLPTALRKEWVLKAAQTGKHVLCEKPCGVTAEDVRHMVAECEHNGVQFMDGVMFMHSRRIARLREILADGETVGRVRRICAQFTFCAPEDWVQSNIRTSSELEPHGSLGDLGWYTIRIAMCVMNGELPERVSGRMIDQRGQSDSESLVPIEFSGELFFADNVTAGYYCSFQTENQQWLHVSGSNGSAYIPDFVLPFFGSQSEIQLSHPQFEVKGCDFNMEEQSERIAINEYSNSDTNAQETNMFREFGRLALSGTPDPAWGQWSLKTQQVLDACLASARDGGTLMNPAEF